MSSNAKFNELIRNWIRPLQKSLTIETENKFVNILGRERHFNEFLYNSFNNLDYLNLPEEYKKLFIEFSSRYNEYNNLDINQRKRLVIDTRKTLFKLGKSIENTSSSRKANNYKGETNSNLSLTSDISLIKSIGKVYKNKLNEIGIFNIKDLINYFPRKYLNYTNRVKIKDLKPDNLYTCIGNVKKFYIYKSPKNSNLSIMNILIFDETSSIKVTKFYLGKRFRSYSFFSSQKSLYLPGT